MAEVSGTLREIQQVCGYTSKRDTCEGAVIGVGYSGVGINVNVKASSSANHVSAPTSADLISPNEFLTSFMFNPKFTIILFTCLMLEHDQRQ